MTKPNDENEGQTPSAAICVEGMARTLCQMPFKYLRTKDKKTTKKKDKGRYTMVACHMDQQRHSMHIGVKKSHFVIMVQRTNDGIEMDCEDLCQEFDIYIEK